MSGDLSFAGCRPLRKYAETAQPLIGLEKVSEALYVSSSRILDACVTADSHEPFELNATQRRVTAGRLGGHFPASCRGEHTSLPSPQTAAPSPIIDSDFPYEQIQRSHHKMRLPFCGCPAPTCKVG